MDHSTQRIIIIGGSIAGLFAGLLLRNLGWSVSIFERSTEALANRGAGITTHNELYAALRQADLKLRPLMGVSSVGRVMFDREGNTVGTLELPQILTSWGFLYRFLRENFPDTDYQHGHTLSDIRIGPDHVDAIFENGRTARGTYLIGADGIRSSTRALLLPESNARYVGYTAWRGLVDERDVPAALLAHTGERMAFCLPPGEHFLGYWVAGPDDDLTPGRRWYNWVWYRPASADTRLHELLTGIDGNVYMEGIPPHLIQPNFVAAMKADASNLLAPFLAKTVWATNRPFLQPIYEASSERLVFDRCITIGDAAFTARPHIGMGVSKAADDAARLAEAFCSHPDSSSGAVTRSIEHFTIALKNWEAQRLAFGRATVQQSANLGAYVAGSSENVAIKRLHAYYRQPEIVMQQIAAGNPYLYLNTDVCISLNLK